MAFVGALLKRFLILDDGNDLCLVENSDAEIARYVFRSEKLLKGAWRRPLLDLFEVNSTQLGARRMTWCRRVTGYGGRARRVADRA